MKIKGEKVTFKEFVRRWKEGIESIPPLKQTQISIRSSYISQLGIFLGIVMCFISLKTLWWLLIILIGAFFNNYMSIIALKQKVKQLKMFDSMIKIQEEKK